MYRKTLNATALKSHNSNNGKRGFTLVELSVVLALLAILTTMIISFSVLMNGFAKENKAEYDFSEDHATLKKAICIWAAENDVSGNVFSVNDDGTLTVTSDGTEKNVSFDDGVLTLDTKQRSGLDAIDGVIFTTNGKLVKCETYRIGKNGKQCQYRHRGGNK